MLEYLLIKIEYQFNHMLFKIISKINFNDQYPITVVYLWFANQRTSRWYWNRWSEIHLIEIRYCRLYLKDKYPCILIIIPIRLNQCDFRVISLISAYRRYSQTIIANIWSLHHAVRTAITWKRITIVTFLTAYCLTIATNIQTESIYHCIALLTNASIVHCLE